MTKGRRKQENGIEGNLRCGPVRGHARKEYVRLVCLAREPYILTLHFPQLYRILEWVRQKVVDGRTGVQTFKDVN